MNQLTMHNFCIFEGTQTLDFGVASKNKPIVLVGGSNGRGKTTILQAVSLCLYGSRAAAFVSQKLPYSQYLKECIHHNCLNASLRMEVVLDIDEQPTTIQIDRKWSVGAKAKGIEESFEVSCEGQKDDYLTDNWANHMEMIMPATMSQFFLFDGESIGRLTSEHNDRQFKSAMRTLLGLDVVDVLEGDIKTLIEKNSVLASLQVQDAELQSIKSKDEQLAKQLSQIEQEILQYQKTIDQNNEKQIQLENQFVKEGGKIWNGKIEKQKKKQKLERQQKECEQGITKWLEGSAPLLMVHKLLQAMQDTAQKESDFDAVQEQYESVQEFVKEYALSEKSLLDALKLLGQRKEYFQAKLPQDRLGMTKHTKQQLSFLLAQDKETEFEKVNKQLHHRQKIQKEIDKQTRYLDAQTHKKPIVSSLIEQIKKLNTQVATDTNQLSQLQAQKIQIEQEKSATQEQLIKLLENRIGQLDGRDAATKIAKHATMVQSVLKIFAQKVQKQKVDAIAQIIQEKFAMILGKQGLVDGIQIDSTSLDLVLYGRSRQIIPHNSLSAGEQQLLATAILWGIIDYTAYQFPLMIDTPLARLDAAHRKNYVHNYLPKVSNQVIVLSTNAEIVGSLKDRIADKIAITYLLQYEETTHSTKIEKGYFEECL